jgi:hypothetical protein
VRTQRRRHSRRHSAPDACVALLVLAQQLCHLLAQLLDLQGGKGAVGRERTQLLRSTLSGWRTGTVSTPAGAAARVRTASVFLLRMRRILPTPSRHCVLLQQRGTAGVRGEQWRWAGQQGRWRAVSRGGGQGGAVLLGSRGWQCRRTGRWMGSRCCQGWAAERGRWGCTRQGDPASGERGRQLQGLQTHHLLWLKPKSCILRGGQGRHPACRLSNCCVPSIRGLFR